MSSNNLAFPFVLFYNLSDFVLRSLFSLLVWKRTVTDGKKVLLNPSQKMNKYVFQCKLNLNYLSSIRMKGATLDTKSKFIVEQRVEETCYMSLLF